MLEKVVKFSPITVGTAWFQTGLYGVSSRSGSLLTLSPLRTTRASFPARGSGIKYPTRHRVLPRNSRHRYSVKEFRHRSSLKRILGFSRIPPSQLVILKFPLVHRIGSMASLSSTLSFSVCRAILMHPRQYNGNEFEKTFFSSIPA